MSQLALETVYKPRVFGIVSQITGMPLAEVNDQAVIPAKWQAAVIEQVTDALCTAPLIFGDEANLTAGQVAEEAERRP